MPIDNLLTACRRTSSHFYNYDGIHLVPDVNFDQGLVQQLDNLRHILLAKSQIYDIYEFISNPNTTLLQECREIALLGHHEDLRTTYRTGVTEERHRERLYLAPIIPRTNSFTSIHSLKGAILRCWPLFFIFLYTGLSL